jgi:hypothetical protein
MLVFERIYCTIIYRAKLPANRDNFIVARYRVSAWWGFLGVGPERDCFSLHVIVKSIFPLS